MGLKSKKIPDFRVETSGMAPARAVIAGACLDLEVWASTIGAWLS